MIKRKKTFKLLMVSMVVVCIYIMPALAAEEPDGAAEEQVAVTSEVVFDLDSLSLAELATDKEAERGEQEIAEMEAEEEVIVTSEGTSNSKNLSITGLGTEKLIEFSYYYNIQPILIRGVALVSLFVPR